MTDDNRLRAKGTGTAEWRNGHHWVRVSLPDGSRPRYRLCLETCTCASMSEAMIAERCQAISERKREQYRAEQAELEALAKAKRMTVRQLGEAWTDGSLLEAHGRANKLKEKASAGEDKYRLEHAYDVKVTGGRGFGSLLVSDVTELDAQRVMALAPKGKDWRPSTLLQLYQALHRLFELAIVPCRLRPRGSNPFTSELRPHVPVGDLIFGWLYPDEAMALFRAPSEKVPLVRRVLYLVAIWTGQRKESLRALKWGHVDFDHGVLTSPAQKNGVPLTFDMPADLSAVLEGWRAHQGYPAPNKPIFGKLGCRWQRLAEQLRADLLAAGVTRAALQGSEEHEEPLRFHDLRATLVVWALKDPGKGYGWATDRTGHLTPAMLRRYDRAARNWREAKIVPFPPLVTGLSEKQTSAIAELSPYLPIKHLRVAG